MLAINFSSVIGMYTSLMAMLSGSALGQSGQGLPFPASTLVQLNESGTFFENLLVRRNGDILITMLHPQPSIYLLREPWSDTPALSVLHQFDEIDGLGGIVEIRPDTYAVVGTKWESLFVPVANSATLQELTISQDYTVTASRIVARIPKAGSLNGAVVVPGSPSFVLGADSLLGVVWRIDLISGQSDIAIDVPEMKALDPDATLTVGVNGLKVRHGHLYWSNSNLVGVYRIKIDSSGFAEVNATVEEVVRLSDATGADDFNFDHRGDIYITTHIDNTLYRFSQDGSTQLVAGSITSLSLAGDSALAFGRSACDGHIAYITTGGGLFAPVNGTVTEPAKIVAVNTGDAS